MTWNDVTIGQYIQIRQIIESNVDDIYKNAELLKVMYPDKDITNLPLNDYANLLKSLAFMKDEFTTDMEGVRDIYTIGGYTLVFHKNIANVSTAQYIDYVNFIKGVKSELELIAAYPKVLSVFLVPQGKNYNEGYDITDLQKQIEGQMSIVDAANIAFFLTICSKIYIKIFLKSFKRKVRKMKMKKDQLHQVETALQSMECLI